MTAGSRKRRRPDGRNVSPPLTASTLLTRNLQLLPVGLTQLPNDETFVSRLRQDIENLLSGFAEALLLAVCTSKSSVSRIQETGLLSSMIGSSTGATESSQLAFSAFSVFAHLWRQKGWHYIQFAFGDHTDSKRAVSDAICRVLLEHLEPYMNAGNRSCTREQELRDSIAFTDIKQVLTAVGIPFALFLFWSTQVYPTSGIGVKHCRPAMERIPIEQCYYDLLLDLPSSVSKHLQEEQRTKRFANSLTADLTEVLCRLVGQTPNDKLADQVSPPVLSAAQIQRSKKGQRQPWQDQVGSRDSITKSETDPVFDIIPASCLATRLPRTWPSVRVMSSLEANKEFGRVGRLVRISSGTVGTLSAGPSSAVQVSHRGGQGSTAAESREVVAGLSRGDMVRLKAKQRLARASMDISKLLDQHGGQTGSVMDYTPIPVEMSEPAEPDALGSVQGGESQSTRYEIETPSWIKRAKYTSKMQPWLEESSMPTQQSLQRSSTSKRRYREVRDKIMRCSVDTARSGEGGAETETSIADYGEWILQSFRETRHELQQECRETNEQVRAQGDSQPGIHVVGGDVPSVEDAGTLTMASLYRLAAEHTKTAAVERGERLKRSARASGSPSK